MRLFVQQFSFWPCLSSPGEGTRPTPPTIPPSCRPGALTRRPYLLHNENCCQERTAACGCARAVAILVAKIKVKAHPFAVVGTLGWRHPHLVQPPLKVSPYFWRNRLHGNALGSHRPPSGAGFELWGKLLGGGKRKSRPKRSLQPKPRGAKMAAMKRTDSLAAGNRWPIIPKWEDRQVCLITCWAELRMQQHYS